MAVDRALIENSNLVSITSMELQDLTLLKTKLPLDPTIPLTEDEKVACDNWNKYIDKLLLKRGIKNIDISLNLSKVVY